MHETTCQLYMVRVEPLDSVCDLAVHIIETHTQCALTEMAQHTTFYTVLKLVGVPHVIVLDRTCSVPSPK